MRKIDIFNHIYPPAYYTRLMRIAPDYQDIGKRMRGIPMLADLDVRFRVMDAFDEYEQVLSLPTPPIENIVRGADALELARAANDGMAELVAQTSATFSRRSSRRCAFDDPDAAVREAIRAIDDLGARGIQMFTNVHGTPISAPQFLPIFETLAARDLPIWLHPYRGADMPDFKAEARSEFEIWWTFGWPYETSAAMARLVFAGYFDRFPDLKIITHHMGAMAPYFAGRVGPGWDQLGARTSDGRSRCGVARLEEAPARLLQDVLRRHGAVRRLRRHGLRPRASSAPTTCCLRPTRRSIRKKVRCTSARRSRSSIACRYRPTSARRIYWRNAVRLLKAPGLTRRSIGLLLGRAHRAPLERQVPAANRNPYQSSASS